MKRAWRLAARNLVRNRRRNLATAVAIALGFAGLVLFGGYAIRIERFLRTNTVYLMHTGHLAIYREGGLEKFAAQPARFALPAAEQQRLLEALGRHPEVEFVTRQLTGMGLAGNGCQTLPFVALGVDPAEEARVLHHPEVLAASAELARPLRGRELAAYPGLEGATALSAGLAQLLGKDRVHDQAPTGAPGVVDCAAPDLAARLAGDANLQLAGLTWEGGLSAVDAELVNVFHTSLAETEDGTVVTSLATLQRLYDTDAVTWLAVYLHDAGLAHALAPRLEAELRAAGLPVSVYPFDDARVGPYYAGTMPFLYSLVSFIGSLVVTVVVLSVLNSMTLSVLERGPELGTFRALGYTRGQVLGLYVREAVLLSLLATGAGLVLGLAAAGLVNAAGIRFSPPGVAGTIQLLLTPSPLLCLALAGLFTPLSALACWLAVRSKVRTPVIELVHAHAS
jgi:putative ABC transport system permease protein